MINFSCIKSTHFFNYLGLILAMVITSAVHATTIKVFSLSHQRLIAYQDTQVCYVNRATHTIQQINREIQSAGMVDKKTLLNRYQQDFEAIGKDKMCQAQAKLLGVEKLPAIVFDDHYVIYGEVNIERALASYHHFKEAS